MMKFFLAIVMIAMLAQAEEVAPFLHAQYEKSDAVEKKLQDNGFTIVAKYSALPQSTTIVFSDEALQKEGAKKQRAFIAVMKVFVDDKEKQVSVTNPLYYGPAFMQKDYDKNVFQNEAKKLTKTFGKLTPSKDTLDADDLADYHFMMGMPYYEDQIEVATGDNAELLQKVQSYEGGKRVLFAMKLPSGSVLVGYDLSDKVERFPQKIGRANAGLLPWTIKIEGGEATILHPKYYIALSYPKLSMGQFMTISSVPGEIEDDIEAAFK